MYERYKKNLFFISFLIFLVIGMTLGSFVAFAVPQEEGENFIWLVDVERRSMMDLDETPVLAGDQFVLYHNYDRISVVYRCRQNESKVYEEYDLTSRNQLVFHTRDDSELIIFDEEGNELERAHIMEYTFFNRIRHQYGVERFDIVISVLVPFAIILIYLIIKYLNLEEPVI